MTHSVLQEIVFLLLISVCCVVIFKRLSMPPVLAYLFVGICVGPHALGWISDNASIQFLAEFGVVFLMFTVGLEFSLPQLLAMRKDVFAIGGAQVVLSTLVISIVIGLLGHKLSAAIIFGGILALSSTAMVIKQLTEQLEINSRHGRLSLAILLFQDLAVIPFLIIIPMLSHTSDNSIALELALAIVKAVLVIGLMLAIGHWLLRPLFHEVARQHSSELFTLTILLFSMAAAWITDMAGLSLALGSFIAGMMLSETEFKHQVEVDIRPFKDVLMGLFFITVGMLLNIKQLPEILPQVLVFVTGLVIIKYIVVMLICKLANIENGVASRTGISLAQGGEFGFAIMALAFNHGVLDEHLSQTGLATIVMSLLISPFLIRYNGAITKNLFPETYLKAREINLHELEKSTEALDGHIVICGYGRIGQNVSRFLRWEGFSFVALDLDPVIVKNAHEAGDRVYYGDSTHKEVLQAVQLKTARALVISFNDLSGTEKIINSAKQIQKDIPILVRTSDDSHLEKLQNLGVTEVVPETLEASLMLSSHLLLLLDVPMRKILDHIQEVRGKRYQMLHEFFHGQDDIHVSDADAIREGLHSLTIPEGSHCINKTLSEIDFEALHLKLNAICQDGICYQNPSPDELIEPGLVLVVYGKPEDYEHAQGILLSGIN